MKNPKNPAQGPEAAWQALIDAAMVTIGPNDIFDVYGVRRREDGWHVRVDQWAETVIPSEPDGVSVLLLDLVGEDATGIADLLGREVIEEEIARRAAVVALATSRGRPREVGWERVRTEIRDALTMAVAVVPAGGIYCSHADDEGNAAAVELGASVVAGHLDEQMSLVVADFARRRGLAGFRFTDDSWWTEELLAAQEDPAIGAEVLEEQAKGGSWPWVVFACWLPASGPIAELGAISVTEALLGALVLLDHPPGHFWGDTLPWIPGQLTLVQDPRDPATFETDNVLATEPSLVDGRLRRLDNAGQETSGRFPAEIDLGAHAYGPGRLFLAAVADGACRADGPTDEAASLLASACRLAWHAAATGSADVRIELAGSAIEHLLAAGTRDARLPSEYQSLLRAGTIWRVQEDAHWPTSGSIGGRDRLDAGAWTESLLDADELRSFRHDSRTLPAWSSTVLVGAQRSLESLQACALGVASTL
jgi:hypothetical protein